MNEEIKMKPFGKYMLESGIKWIVESDCTPYLVIDATKKGVLVPQEHVVDGRIILNILPKAIDQFVFGEEAISFDSRFNGKVENILLPLHSILAIYAKETGAAIQLQMEEPKPTKPEPQKRPTLKIVK